MLPKQKQEFIKDALWISYTALKDFLRCPRSYYLKNRYRDPKTGNRLQITSAPMTLGSLVHDAIKWYLQTNRTADKDALIKQYRNHWLKYRGKRGGFSSLQEEGDFGRRGLLMLDNFFDNAKALEPNEPVYDFLRYKLDEKILMIGKLDFLGDLKDGSLHVLDFKTGQRDEEDPTQLHTYAILAEANLQKPVSKISYWYLDRDDSPKEAVLDPLEGKVAWLRDKALQIKEAIKKDKWVCKNGEDLCNDCRSYQAIIDGKGLPADASSTSNTSRSDADWHQAMQAGEFQFSDTEFKKDIYYFDGKNP